MKSNVQKKSIRIRAAVTRTAPVRKQTKAPSAQMASSPYVKRDYVPFQSEFLDSLKIGVYIIFAIIIVQYNKAPAWYFLSIMHIYIWYVLAEKFSRLFPRDRVAEAEKRIRFEEKSREKKAMTTEQYLKRENRWRSSLWIGAGLFILAMLVVFYFLLMQVTLK